MLDLNHDFLGSLVRRMQHEPPQQAWSPYFHVPELLAAAVAVLALGLLLVPDVGAAARAGGGALAALGIGYLCARVCRVRSAAGAHEELLRGLLAINQDCLKLLDRNGRVRSISETGQRLAQAMTPDQLLGTDWLSLWSGPEAREVFGQALAGAQTSFSGPCPTLLGRAKWWQSHFLPLKNGRGAIEAVLCVSRDLTSEIESLAELQRKSTLLKDMGKHIQVVFWMTSADFKTLYHVSAAFESMWEIPLATLQREPTGWSQRIHGADLPLLRDQMRMAANTGKSSHASFRLVMPDGRTKWIRTDIHPVRDDEGVVERIVSVCVDVTQERLRVQQLDRMAHIDELTGLANRAAMIELLTKGCAEGLPFALLAIDVDRFKFINDTIGHLTADGLLKDIGKRIREAVPDNATVARSGGDEFTVILPGRWRHKDIERLCMRLVMLTRRPVPAADQMVTLTLSVGAALFPEHGDSPEALLTSADITMDAVKRSGRNTYRLFGAEEQSRLSRFQLEVELRDALQLKQFVLVYQPQFSVRSRRLIGVEALMRWEHPKDGPVPSSVFIPILEQTGLIVEVGHWIIREAIAALHTWRAAGLGDISMSINVSPRQFRDDALIASLRSALGEYGINASRITVEITESTLIDSEKQALEVLAQLRRMGIRTAVDDFGTGYSSLSYVTRFRPDTVKLDKSFIDGIATDSAARTMVEGVIELAHKLNISVLSEGVETEAQLDILRAAHCDELQGYLFGEPVPHDAFLARFGNAAQANEPQAGALRPA